MTDTPTPPDRGDYAQTPKEDSSPLSTDALLACVEMVGRTGAKDFELGWLNDPGESAYVKHGAQWWAKAQYLGERIFVEDFDRPDDACQALAERLLYGAKCTHCGGLVALSDEGAFAFESGRLMDGTTWTVDEAAAAGQCRWQRVGPHWKRGCEGRKPSRREKRANRRNPR